jgi:protein-L-isoaspartate O-methyltransferase
VADFARHDPATAAFWDERYRAGFTPWDASGVPAALTRFVEAARPGRRVLVPGCGSAYEAGWLHARGFDVLAIDIAPLAIERAREILGDAVADRVLRQEDFLTLQAEFDWIYERALLCALPYRLWDEYAEAAHRLLAPSGVLAGFFFIHQAADQPRRGPPFSAHPTELDGLFAHRFERLADEAVPAAESIPVFAGHERWMVWRRRDAAREATAAVAS